MENIYEGILPVHPVSKLDIATFSKLSAERAEMGFKTYRNVPITYWTTALMGEGGELCNMIKKMERVAHGGIDGGSSYTAATISKKDLAEEIGGIFIYLNILSGLLDIDMEEAIIETFNSKSEKYSFSQFYPPSAF
jgi:NTP pyrophosphatase (non-canonical NTP hydrolase)